jgi:hypothetical protein
MNLFRRLTIDNQGTGLWLTTKLLTYLFSQNGIERFPNPLLAPTPKIPKRPYCTVKNHAVKDAMDTLFLIHIGSH